MSISSEQARIKAWAERLRTKQRALVEETRPTSSTKPEAEKAPGAFDFDLLETNAPTHRGAEGEASADARLVPPGAAPESDQDPDQEPDQDPGHDPDHDPENDRDGPVE